MLNENQEDTWNTTLDDVIQLDSPEDKHVGGSVVRLPGIREDATPCTPNRSEQIHQELVYTGITLVGAPTTPTGNRKGVSGTPPSTTLSSLSTPQESQNSTKMSLQTPSTPRIDISRASSSSHQDSRDSTPERELFDGQGHGGAKLGLAFEEEGALDLRSSTEELDFHDPQEKLKYQKTRPQSPCQQDSSLCHRKDSQSSEIGLLSISGRTSRLSSIGSQGSAHSRVSNVSHLSIVSSQSGRSPSPHKMLLETSFCGHKSPVLTQQLTEQLGTKIDSDVLEKLLLSRKHDPREAILAEGIVMDVNSKGENKRKPPERLVRKNIANTKANITITVDKPGISDSANEKPKLPRTFVSPSGVEYIYIPLKGPLPPDEKKDVVQKPKSASVTQSRPAQNKSKELNKNKSKSACSSPSVQKPIVSPLSPSIHSDEPKYIRIKLKPDYMYENEPSSSSEVHKPDCLNLEQVIKKRSFTSGVKEPQIETVTVEKSVKSLTETPTDSPKLSRRKIIKDANTNKTPSPSLSRRSSFTSLFKSKETIVSPESPTVPGLKRKNTLSGILKDASDNILEKTRSRSKSRERDKSSVSTLPSSSESIDSNKSKQKSVLSIFKPKKSTKLKSNQDRSSPEIAHSLDGISNVEFKFNNEKYEKYYETPLQGESIRIPLHSPTHYEEKSILQELKSSSQDSQETVIDTTKRSEPDKDEDKNSKRQFSTSSENLVFTTELGSNNDVFTTKLPKEKQTKKTSNDVKHEITHNGVVPEFLREKRSLTIDKSVTLNEIKKITENGTKETKIVKTESLNLSKITTGSTSVECSKDVVLKELGEGSKRLKKSIMGSLTTEERNSSESEKDSELDYLKTKKEENKSEEFVEPERKGLVLQQDSFDDELPYIPTTLPLERSVAVPIVPVKQRGTFEMKTYPIERPRSTTPINLSTLEDYCEDVMGAINSENITKAIEKLKISLPKDESVDRSTKTKSPRKPGSNWFTFSDKGQKHPSPTQDADITPPPLPPKGVQKEWINFEEIPERRKPPRRIQTIPSRGTIEVPESVLQDNVVYSYVNPEDCKCECHGIAREREQQNRQQEEPIRVQEDEVPLLDDEPVEDEKSTQENIDRIKVDIQTYDRRSIISDSSLDLSMSLEQQETSIQLEPSLRTPFTGDLGISSNRSSIVSQDEPQSPDVMSPNAFPKTS
ncbi:hypothetical protein RN001_002905 [Aquatica leii]|uniref:Uncharacterized protein n=1 Tax=Aquatica leii TaxID=1421715 RepID=A0AAN7SM18_9COLE|nr:hypothetical protein RN001_002905 [Aquatica leii]